MSPRFRRPSVGWRTAALALVAVAFPSLLTAQTRPPTEIRYLVRDSLSVVADVHHGSGGPSAPTVLLFHQGGGSARGEYRNITPRLLRDGYNVVAPDIRGGGDRFGAPSRAAPTDSTFTYCAALGEVDAAVNLARTEGFTGPLVLWGSSYTATLALQVAARRSAEIRAVLAFSPATGEPMRGCEPAPYVGWLARAGVPAMVLRPRVELADSARIASLAAMRRDGATTVIAERGVHGSSMLDTERTRASTEREWAAVEGFLRRALAPRAPMAGERTVSIPSDGWTLRGDLRPPPAAPGPLVVLLHKGAGDRSIYRALAARLAAAGIGSLRVDLRGHGESVNRGRFVPGRSDSLVAGTDRDVAAVWRYVRALPGVDTARLGVVSGSYSSEAAAVAGRTAGFGRAQVALSPGDFSDESFRAAAASRAAWLFVRSDNERFVREWLDAKVHALAPAAELWVVAAGSAHATDLLAADATLAERLSDWLAGRLAGARGNGALQLTYLANEGVMLESRQGRVLIDALFGDGLPDYAVVPRTMRDSLERGRGVFGGPMIVVTTHAHRDHYDAAAVARYREHNSASIVVGPPASVGGDQGKPVDLGWIQVRPLALPHGPTVRPVGHAAYLVTLDGVTALHLGDTQSDPATWVAAGVPAAGVDLALVPFWYAMDQGRFETLLEVLRAGTVVLLHTPRDEDGRWAARRRELQDRYPHVRIPRASGDLIEVASRASPTGSAAAAPRRPEPTGTAE